MADPSPSRGGRGDGPHGWRAIASAFDADTATTARQRAVAAAARRIAFFTGSRLGLALPGAQGPRPRELIRSPPPRFSLEGSVSSFDSLSACEDSLPRTRRTRRLPLSPKIPTGGMSSQKETIELPSGLFALYVSVRSNMGRFNGGRGIEGIGVVPHETVENEGADLAKGIDTLLRRAESLLANFPREKVPYRPEEYGWKRSG